MPKFTVTLKEPKNVTLYDISARTTSEAFKKACAKQGYDSPGTLCRGYVGSGKEREPFSIRFEEPKDPAKDEAARESARGIGEVIGHDDIQVATNAPVEHVEDGAWVTVRVWVPNLL